MTPIRAAMLLTTVALALVPAASAHGVAGNQPEGVLSEVHGDDFVDNREVGSTYELDTGHGRTRLSIDAKLAERLLGKHVRLDGQEQADGSFAATGGTATTTASTTTASAVTGSKRLAVVLLDFSNDRATPWTPTQVANYVFSASNGVAAYYRDASFGQLTLTGDVLGWYQIAADDSGCAYSTWQSQADQLAAAAGVSLSSYDYVQYVFPQASSCSWGGLGQLPGRLSWINGYLDVRPMTHELGHNFGVHHANTDNCTDAGGARVPLSGTCTSTEYGDPFSTMGNWRYTLHHGWARGQMGWLIPQTVTGSGTYTIAPDEGPSATPQVLSIPRGNGTFLDLDYRQPFGVFDTFATGSPVTTGVSVRLTYGLSSLTQSQLLDMTPSTSTFDDSALQPGRSFTDFLSGITIAVAAASSSGATVTVTFPPPGQPQSLTAAAAGSSAINLSWGAAQGQIAGYRILRNGVQVGTTTGLTYSDTGLQPSTTYGYSVIAYDAGGQTGPAATASATTTAPDTTPPGAPGTLTASVRAKKVTLRWGAASDDVGVAGYRVYRNGVQIGTTTGTSVQTQPGSGTWTYTVAAYDAAGNVGPLSNAVTVKV